MAMMIVNDGDALGKDDQVDASPNMAKHCWFVKIGIRIIHSRDKIMMVFMMMMTMIAMTKLTMTMIMAMAMHVCHV